MGIQGGGRSTIRRGILGFALLGVLLAFPQSVDAQGFIITGRVTDPEGNGIPDVDIDILTHLLMGDITAIIKGVKDPTLLPRTTLYPPLPEAVRRLAP